jgi:hypothetical protein
VVVFGDARDLGRFVTLRPPKYRSPTTRARRPEPHTQRTIARSIQRACISETGE